MCSQTGLVCEHRGFMSARNLALSYELALRRHSTAPNYRIQTTGEGKVPWIYFDFENVVKPLQGWKIHVSSGVLDSIELVDALVPFLCSRGASFKLPATAEAIMRLNDGRAGATQVGKILTIYPAHSDDCIDLVSGVLTLWPTSRGPDVRYDLRVRLDAPVFLRYGAFRGELTAFTPGGLRVSGIRSPSGAIEVDDRFVAAPGWAPPPPVSALSTDQGTDLQTLKIGKRTYLLLRMAHSSPRSQIYEALDVDTFAKVAVKRMALGVAEFTEGASTQRRHKNEALILRVLERKRFAAAPRLLGTSAQRDLWLARTWNLGSCLAQLSQATQIRALPRIARMIDELHRSGLVHRDLKLANVTVHKGQTALLDFELAAQLTKKGCVPGATRSYSRADYCEGYPDVSDDLFG
jgi:hypothetical protein